MKKNKFMKISPMIANLLLESYFILFSFQTTAKGTPLKKINPSKITQSWYKDNKKNLDQLIQDFGIKKFKHTYKRSVAIFDWDNTIIKNDMGDATFFYMITNGLIKKPKNWQETSPYLTEKALQMLEKKCFTKEKFLPTKENPQCADILLDIYTESKLPNGKPAWKNEYNPNILEPSYAWLVGLSSGYKPKELSQIATQAIQWNLNNPIGTQQKIGSKEYVAYVRFYEPIKELIQKLIANDFDVWVATASLQYIIEPFSEEVGITRDHVIGIKPVLNDQGLITSSILGCGTYPQGQTIINYKQGKRCWINKIIFNVTDPAEMLEKPNETILAAGDADTDIFFVRDAKELHLVINRNKEEIMCYAYNNLDNKWLINPMFIDPLPQKKGPYNCKKYSLTNQKDTVY